MFGDFGFDIQFDNFGKPICDDNFHKYVLELDAATKGLKDQEIAELGLLSEAGVVGFSNGDNPIYNPLIMQRVLSYSSMFSLQIFL